MDWQILDFSLRTHMASDLLPSRQMGVLFSSMEKLKMMIAQWKNGN